MLKLIKKKNHKREKDMKLIKKEKENHKREKDMKQLNEGIKKI